MKKDIHPEYKESLVTCSCGESLNTRSTKSELKVEICSKCHPFFTGKQKLIDAGGRVQRFQKKYGIKAEAPKAKGDKVKEEEPV
ncbi:MAG: 50S ribosomal protein L31 [Actinomycetota bacterium]|nr:50S ribosomal protein L31 [Actinomycetota bacterium]